MFGGFFCSVLFTQEFKNWDKNKDSRYSNVLIHLGNKKKRDLNKNFNSKKIILSEHCLIVLHINDLSNIYLGIPKYQVFLKKKKNQGIYKPLTIVVMLTSIGPSVGLTGTKTASVR